MDDNKNLNQPNANTPNNDDYQKILDEYAASIKPEENSDKPIPQSDETKPTPEVTPEPELEFESTVELKEVTPDTTTKEPAKLKDINSLQLEAPDNKSIPADVPDATSTIKSPILNQPVENVPPKSLTDEVKTPNLDLPHEVPESSSTETKTPEEIKAQIDKIFADDSSSSDNFSSVSSLPSAKSGAKNLFFLSVAIFFLVALGWIYLLYFYQQPVKDSNTSQVSPTPTEIISEETCELNGTTYKVGESFKSADGCNTCSCQTGNNIACTEMACDISPTVTSAATKSATTKVTITPTKKVVSTTPAKTTVTPTKTATSSTKKVPTATPILESSEE